MAVRKTLPRAPVAPLPAVTAVVGACSNSQQPATGTQASAPASESATPSGEATAPTGSGVTKISDIFGPVCSQVPTEGPGSAQGMVNDPVGTAASHNPLLSTLTKAATAANLVDTLNSAPAITVFAPADPAFAALETQHPGITKQLTTAPDVASPYRELPKHIDYNDPGSATDSS